jgi:outer membrane lipoprotein-sorting protein
MRRFVFYLVSAAMAVNSAPSASAIRRALEARYRHATTLKAAFYERFSDGKGGGQAESGTVYFSRPGRMRWEYESPQKELFIVDGKNVWFYVPADHAASRAKMKESSDWRMPIALLAGKADLGKMCRDIELIEAPEAGGSSSKTDPLPPSPTGAVLRLRSTQAGFGTTRFERSAEPGDLKTSRPDAGARNVDPKPLSPEDSLLRCTPRDNSDQLGEAIRDVLLETDPGAHLVRVLIRQPGNLETEFRFGNWQENIPIPESKFHFDPPPGVEIVDEEKLAGQIP